MKSFINHRLDWEIDLDLQSMWNLDFVEGGPSECQAARLRLWERKERRGREGVRRSGRGTARPFRS